MQDDLLAEMALAENQILEYKRHIVRSVHAEEVRKTIVQNLLQNEAFITMVNILM